MKHTSMFAVGGQLIMMYSTPMHTTAPLWQRHVHPRLQIISERPVSRVEGSFCCQQRSAYQFDTSLQA